MHILRNPNDVLDAAKVRELEATLNQALKSTADLDILIRTIGTIHFTYCQCYFCSGEFQKEQERKGESDGTHD